MKLLVAILRSDEVWGAWRVFLENVWSLDMRNRHSLKPLCFVVKYGFIALAARNRLTGIIGSDGREPDLR